jgi:DNA polymerase-3 subunit delta'
MIIWLPERMHEACSNKLLKMIEEPPFHTVFLLISENPDRIIATIQSRTQRLPIPPILPEDMYNALSPVITNDSERSTLVHLANGNYLKALEIIETGPETKQHLEMFKTIMRNGWRKDVKNMKAEAEKFAGLGRERQKHFLTYSQNMIRENFLYRLNLPEINYLNPEEADFSRNFSPYVTEKNVEELMEDLALAEKHIESNVNPRMVFFDLSMKIAVLIKK